MTNERARVGRLLASPHDDSVWGGETTGLRDYVPGDDYRYVDWNLCARRGELRTKTFVSGGPRPRYFLLDCSMSMGVGHPTKFDAARRLAAVLGCAALAAGTSVGITAFSGRVLAELPRLCGRNQRLRLLRFLDALALDASPTDLDRAAAVLAGRHQQPGPVAVISDLLNLPDFRKPLERLRQHGYPPRIVQVVAPEEADPPLLGDVELRDVESPRVQRVTLSPHIVARYRELFAQFLASVRRYAARHGLECVQVDSDQSLEAIYAQVLALPRKGKVPSR
jgi:uncharacterized protein (DUF58 family)